MSQDDKTTILNKIKQALSQSTDPKAPLPEPSDYDISRLVPQNASDLFDRFARHAADEGMHVHRFSERKALVIALLKFCKDNQLRQLLITDGLLLNALGIIDAIKNSPHLEMIKWRHKPDTWIKTAFSADASIAAATYALAENGALVLTTSPSQPRLLQLAPPVHICLVTADHLQGDLLDLLQPQNLTSSFTLLAGPSKTSDIEMKLVTGVHGPIEEHIFILE